MPQSKEKQAKMQAPLLNMKGESVGQIDLQDTFAEISPSKEFLHEYVTVYLANQRERSASVKTRSEVSGGGKKPWKQKHTGRARGVYSFSFMETWRGYSWPEAGTPPSGFSQTKSAQGFSACVGR